MRHRIVLLSVFVLGFSALFGESPSGQEQQNVVGGLLSERRPDGGPARPVPRNATGRVVLGGATVKEKGVWVPGPGVTAVAIKPPAEVPFQPWAKAGLRRTADSRAGAAYALQSIGGRAPVPDAVWRRVRRAPRASTHLYLRHRRPPHLSDYLHGWPHASAGPPEDVVRPLGRLVGRRHTRCRIPGFNEGFWLDRKGLPHTEQLRTLEKWTRVTSPA